MEFVGNDHDRVEGLVVDHDLAVPVDHAPSWRIDPNPPDAVDCGKRAQFLEIDDLQIEQAAEKHAEDGQNEI